jgi:hypothetical protein
MRNDTNNGSRWILETTGILVGWMLVVEPTDQQFRLGSSIGYIA